MEPDSPICDACRKIDFSIALDASDQGKLGGRENGMVLDSDARRFALVGQKNCSLCSLLSPQDTGLGSHLELLGRVKLPLIASSYLRNRTGPFYEYLQRETFGSLNMKDSVVLGLGSGRSLALDAHGGSVVCRWARDSEPGFMKPQVVAPAFDAQRARAWIEDCEENHEQTCTEPDQFTAVPGMRFIDCDICKVVNADPSSKWVTLSYRWGPQTKDPSIVHDLSRASPTVRDAMTVARGLGYRYLWVDKYCINQHSALERDDQIQKMDLI
ncbi:hypothetical protein B0T14DRAFT_602848 [Immersiella caudata]|uniref:Heterokaryon incompatibility domain-containing protein n=1 Tax=Immersiella caudata TaxID=314043 RepID=A0AA39WNY2_9PEZI|nr:hypothetical protein B0T14DRAFT_602848 [Immersiella caudata]